MKRHKGWLLKFDGALSKAGLRHDPARPVPQTGLNWYDEDPRTARQIGARDEFNAATDKVPATGEV